MRLVAIFNVWSDHDLLKHSIKHIRPLVDGVIVVYSIYSNFGELDAFFEFEENTTYYKYHPDFNLKPSENERNKRNIGLNSAREMGYTHFLNMDMDEFYLPKEFKKEVERFKNPDLLGLVCRVKCFFASPLLTIGYDTTLVPFIHKLTPDLRFEWNTKYPYAFEGPKREIRIDPTRQMNIDSGVEWSDIIMHHYSWIRDDYQKKIRNSTARENIERSTIVKDLLNAKEGYYCEFYGKQLEASSDPFNLCSLPFITKSKTSFNGNP